ncbi:ABC transporter permease [bacterium]|nr:ABC transporter permease [bacterium]
MKAFLQNVFDNPILTRELRRRMRGKALIYSMIGYIILMTITSMLVLLASFSISNQEMTQEALAQMADTGQRLYRWITSIQMLLVLIIAPTITAGMTTGEKEKKTFDFLRVTTITPWMYIMGCFLSTVFYVALALLCALPLISLAFLYGGIGKVDVLSAAGELLGGSMILSALGLYISSIRERTRTAQGIVVFMIFITLFGGMFAMSQISAWLGTTGGGMTLSSTNSLGLPVWAMVGGGVILLTGVFLLLAARKLFEPTETRAFSHWQFGLISAIIVGIYLATTSGQTLGFNTILGFLTVGCVLLVVAVSCFSVGRMEVGDEIWHLKRLIPFLRPIDQTVPFLIAVGLLWYIAGEFFLGHVGSLGPTPPGMVESTVLLSLASYAFFCTFGRFATSLTVGRMGAGRITLGVVAGFWILLPIIGGAFNAAAINSEGAMARLGDLIGRFSPFYVMIEGIEQAALYKSASSFFINPVSIQIIGYGLLALIFLGVGEYKRFKRWRGFDYHFDMPTG